MTDRLIDLIARSLVSSPIRGLIAGLLVAWILWHAMGPWSALLVLAGAAWECVRWPGKVRWVP